MAAKTKVTVAIPTYNRAALLRLALASALSQEYSDFGVIVLDNASTDDTEAVVRSFAHSRLTYLRNETNIGQVPNWNRAIEVNSSTYLVVLADDDLLLPGFISESVRELDEYSSAAFSCAMPKYIDVDGNTLQRSIKPCMAAGLNRGLEFLHSVAAGHPCEVACSSVLMRASALAEVGTFDSAHSHHTTDRNLYYRLARKFDIVFIPRELVQVRLHPGQWFNTTWRSPQGTGRIASIAERMDTIGYLLQSNRATDSSYRNWLAERLFRWNEQRSEFTQLLVPSLHWSWEERLRIAKDDLNALIPIGASFVLVDESQWGPEALNGRRAIPFLERDGLYWGPPPDSETAILELERLRGSGASFIVFSWPAFGWLDDYSGFQEYLSLKFRRVLKNSRVVVFELSDGELSYRNQTSKQGSSAGDPFGRGKVLTAV